LVPGAVYAAAAIPAAAAAVVLAVGRIEGTSADRYLISALGHRRSPRRMVPAPGGIPAASAPVAGQAGPAPAPLRLAVVGVDEHGVVDLGGDGRALICRAHASSFSLRTPAEQEAMVAGFGRWLNSLSEPVQIVVRAEPVDLASTVAALEQAAPGLPHPDLEAACRDHAGFLADLARRGLLARQVLVALRHPPNSSGNDGGGEGLARRATQAGAALAAAGITLQSLDQAAATSLLAGAADPANAHPVTPSLDNVPVTAAENPDGSSLEGDLW
ncbi:MAG: PrgI family protein, partial [Acidimicrobiales bacterium]